MTGLCCRPKIENKNMKRLTTKRGTTYYRNDFWGFFVLPANGNRKKETIFKEGSRMYEWLSNQNGWIDENDTLTMPDKY